MKWSAILLVLIASTASGAEWRSLSQLDSSSAKANPLALDYLLVLEQRAVADIYIPPATQLLASFKVEGQSVAGAGWEVHAPLQTGDNYILQSTFDATSPTSKPRANKRTLSPETAQLIREIWTNVIRDARFGPSANIIHGVDYTFEVLDPALGQLSAYTSLKDTARPPGMIVAAGDAVLVYADSDELGEQVLRDRLTFIRKQLIQFYEGRGARSSNSSLGRP